MGLFSNNKKLCPVCGKPTPRLLATKVEDMPICKDCDRKIDTRVDESERERRRASGEDHKRRQGNCCDNRFEFHVKLLCL